MTYNAFFRKSYEVVGYTADANTWCLECAKERYGAEPDRELREDSEGNTVHPVFLDGATDDDTCGKCHARLTD